MEGRLRNAPDEGPDKLAGYGPGFAEGVPPPRPEGIAGRRRWHAGKGWPTNRKGHRRARSPRMPICAGSDTPMTATIRICAPATLGRPALNAAIGLRENSTEWRCERYGDDCRGRPAASRRQSWLGRPTRAIPTTVGDKAARNRAGSRRLVQADANPPRAAASDGCGCRPAMLDRMGLAWPLLPMGQSLRAPVSLLWAFPACFGA